MLVAPKLFAEYKKKELETIWHDQKPELGKLYGIGSYVFPLTINKMNVCKKQKPNFPSSVQKSALARSKVSRFPSSS